MGDPPKLLDRVRLAIRSRHYSCRTEHAYVGWVRRYILFHRTRHPSEMGEAEVAAFLTALASARRVAGSTQNQALSALLFLYRHVLGHGAAWGSGLTPVVRPVRLPVVLTRGEVASILGRLRDPPRLVCELLYGGGLRLLEALTLRVKDIDEVRGEIRIRDGKGRKDRVTVLPAAVRQRLQEQLARVRAQHDGDLGAGRVALPYRDPAYRVIATSVVRRISGFRCIPVRMAVLHCGLSWRLGTSLAAHLTLGARQTSQTE
jgi:integrase